MKPQDRRAAIAAYKEQKQAAGVYAVHCQVGDLAWIATSSNLDTIENRLWFTLRQGTHPNAALQQAWNAHGEEAFSVEILEQLDDDVSDISRPRILKERQALWRTKLSAPAL